MCIRIKFYRFGGVFQHICLTFYATFRIALQMQEKASVFDKLRDARHLADPEQDHGINDDGGDADIKTICLLT